MGSSIKSAFNTSPPKRVDLTSSVAGTIKDPRNMMGNIKQASPPKPQPLQQDRAALLAQQEAQAQGYNDPLPRPQNSGLLQELPQENRNIIYGLGGSKPPQFQQGNSFGSGSVLKRMMAQQGQTVKDLGTMPSLSRPPREAPPGMMYTQGPMHGRKGAADWKLVPDDGNGGKLRSIMDQQGRERKSGQIQDPVTGQIRFESPEEQQSRLEGIQRDREQGKKIFGGQSELERAMAQQGQTVNRTFSPQESLSRNNSPQLDKWGRFMPNRRNPRAGTAIQGGMASQGGMANTGSQAGSGGRFDMIRNTLGQAASTGQPPTMLQPQPPMGQPPMNQPQATPQSPISAIKPVQPLPPSPEAPKAQAPTPQIAGVVPPQETDEEKKRKLAGQAL